MRTQVALEHSSRKKWVDMYLAPDELSCLHGAYPPVQSALPSLAVSLLTE